MKYLYVAIILFLGVFSCAPKNYEKPKDLIGKSDMIDILTDLYISQQGLQMYPIQNEDQSLVLAKDAVDILNAYDVSINTFQESYKYYMMQPEKMKKMLDEVKNNLEDKLSKEEKERQNTQKNNLEEFKPQ
ncbi:MULTISPECIES: DUF4296 domain-containing protein [Empedobacter]|uniref:DUF4296 domain-containing protein n=1 Tax=Empedobacter stercoris TaxID=1628248 RepID=A0ABX1WMH0_9FLAO|nr:MULTISPECIES: DUF4296 domain-containing protein [Empedobacter]MCA4775998.1 DUF4296 domain-containing protein [Empedobacter stercoris]MCA4781152.1 DUF4296 domain-containing protein [Empedobacter stercoris]MCA4809097.1 DUF4296 domain-containing protein [Empedobacter stercoris]MDM1521747.1 DUF4296 domain-containing protein [Empedobacter sp. 225-1]MDM1541937.1 DUF4296 domain-containing protein [Empedobacter sp. 189-2]